MTWSRSIIAISVCTLGLMGSGLSHGAVTLKLDRDAYSALPGATISLAVHLDADDSTPELEPLAKGLRHFGIQLLGRHIATAAAAPDLDYHGLAPGALTSVFPDSAQVRGDAAPALADGYFGSLISSYTLAIPSHAAGSRTISINVIEALTNDDGVILPSDGFVLNDQAVVTIVPEPAGAPLAVLGACVFVRRRAHPLTDNHRSE